MKAKTLLYALPLLLLLAACGTVQPDPEFGGSPSLDITTLALDPTIIDFESGLSAGDIVDFVDAARGMSGTDAGGFVGVNGTNPDLPTANAAMIYDATCGGSVAGCSGEDADLYHPGAGNVLIISEDLDSSDPDDASTGGSSIEFDFSTWGDGTVAVGQLSATILDHNDIDGAIGDDVGAHVRLYDHNDLMMDELPLLATGDGGQGSVTALINHLGVSRMVVTLPGSGAIDNITVATDFPDGGEGCSPALWLRRGQWNNWVGYEPGNSFDEVFGVASSNDPTLIETLPFAGHGEQGLQRHAVAALLNATSGIDYLYTRADVIALTQQGYATGYYGQVKRLMRLQNLLACPLVTRTQPSQDY